MLVRGTLIGQASGSLAGVTAGHNSAGYYLRNRTVPVNPNTAFQLQARAAFTDLVNRWLTTLTSAQRASWALYAANVPITNALGETIFISGQNWYVACNTPRIQAASKLSAAISYVDAGPNLFNRGDFPTPVPAWDETSGLSLVFNASADWANEDDAAMLIYQGRPVNATRNYFKGPFRLIGAILGDSITPPTSPDTISAATLAAQGFSIAADQGVHTKVIVARADGRLSSPRIVGPTIVT